MGQVLPQIVGEHRLDERMDEEDEGGDEEGREVADGHPGLVRAGQEVEGVHQRQRLGRAEEPRDGISRGTDLERSRDMMPSTVEETRRDDTLNAQHCTTWETFVLSAKCNFIFLYFFKTD